MTMYAIPSLVLSVLSLCILYEETVATETQTDFQDTKHAPLTNVASKTVSKDLKPKYVVCYFSSWSAQRADRGKFLPSDIDPNTCTHIIYAFANLNNETLTMVSSSPYVDIEQRFYEHIVNLKKQNQKLKILLSLGGWGDSGDNKYSRMVSEPRSRSRFVKETVIFLNKYKFDGLDLDWEFPVCPQADCSKGDPDDKMNFVHLVQELREAFNAVSPSLMLTTALSGSAYFAQKAYDVASLAKYVDFINVMSYNFHGSWEKATGHFAEMYGHSVTNNESHSTASIMNYYEQQGSPPEKLMMGIPLFGRSFILSNPNNNDIGAPAKGAGIEGIYTKESGILAYYEICDLIQNNNWTVRRDPSAGPYAFRGDQWVGYDDPTSAKNKAFFILQKGYGGAVVWDISFDDFVGRCHMRTFPIIRELKMILHPESIKIKASGSSITMDKCKEIHLWIASWIASFMFLRELMNF